MMIEHEFPVSGGYAAAALQMLLGISLLLREIPGWRRTANRLAVLARPYFFSFYPVVLLVYALYCVSVRL
jgi:hypothetical protein